MGVLQRIAICYLLASWLYLLVYKPGTVADGNASRERSRTLTTNGSIAMIAAILLVGYWALLMFVPVPGYSAGHLNPNDNLGAYIDRTLMSGHLWSESKTWDPEGFLSTLPAIATTLIGILAGEWLRSEQSGRRKAIGLLVSGAVFMLVGRSLHPYFPINKNLWTSTFVLFTGGFAMLLFAVCFWIVDLRGRRKWAAPFLAFGTNAILAYALAAIISEISTDFQFTFAVDRDQTLHGWLYERFFIPHAAPNNASLAFAIVFVFCIFVCLWPLYRRRIFVRV